MNPEQVTATLQIVTALIPIGITSVDALARAVTAIFGPISDEELTAKLDWLKQDATVRAALAQADAGGAG